MSEPTPFNAAAFTETQRKVAEAKPVTPEEVRALPWPAGCAGFRVPFHYEGYYLPEFEAIEVASAVASWWFRMRAEANNQDWMYDLYAGIPKEDDEIRQREWQYWTRSADAWDLVQRRL